MTVFSRCRSEGDRVADAVRAIGRAGPRTEFESIAGPEVEIDDATDEV